jgi:hypothetical protein
MSLSFIFCPNVSNLVLKKQLSHLKVEDIDFYLLENDAEHF